MTEDFRWWRERHTAKESPRFLGIRHLRGERKKKQRDREREEKKEGREEGVREREEDNYT